LLVVRQQVLHILKRSEMEAEVEKDAADPQGLGDGVRAKVPISP